MAIYWIDPHLNSPIGGIHGTTGSGSGTYASPYSLVQMHTLAAGSYGVDDEFRIKGLPEATYFPTQKTFASAPTTTNNGVTYVTIYTIQSGDTHKLLMLKDKDTNDRIFTSVDSTNRMRSVPSTSTWYGGLGQLDTTFGYYPLDTQYAITTSAVQSGIAATTYQMFRNIPVLSGIKVTSGWTSETVRDGISVIHFDYSYTSTWNVFFGGSSTSNRRLIIDCPELILSNRYNAYTYALGIETKMKAYVGSFYNPGYNTEIHNNGNLTVTNFTGGGGYSYIYNYGTTATTFTIDIDYWSGSYQNAMYLYYTNASAVFSLALDQFYAERALFVQNQSGGSNRPLSIPFKNGWAFETRSDNFSVSFTSTFGITENFGTRKNPAYYEGVSGIETNIFSYLSAPGSNIAITSASANLESDSASILKTVYTSSTLYRSFAKLFTHQQTLETVDYCPFYITSTTTTGSPSKVNILADSVSGRPCQFISPSSGGACILAFNSPSFNNKQVWHFFPECNGRTYSDTFPVGSIDPNLTNIFQFTLITSTTPGLNITVRLYLMNSIGTPVQYNTIVPVVDGNTISASVTIDPAFISSNTSKSGFAMIEATKTSTAVANLAIDTLRIVKT
jgi:hypothetical protein